MQHDSLIETKPLQLAAEAGQTEERKEIVSDKIITPSRQSKTVAELMKLGFVPIPLNGKIPVIPEWQKLTAKDVRKEWFVRGGNIGVRTGTGFFVVDIDAKNGGLESWNELRKDHEVPLTVTTATGSGGYHYYFKIPDGVTIRNSISKIRRGIDIRGEGGQVVVPPSVHPETGKPYKWSHGLGPREIGVAEAPRWLIDLIQSPEPMAVAEDKPIIKVGKPEVKKFRTGQRNSGLTSLAGAYRAQGFSRSHVLALLEIDNENLCEPPLPSTEVERIAESISRYDAGSKPESEERHTKRGWSAKDLLSTTFSEPVWIVPGIVPAGLTILGGRPKVGKSWMMLQIANAVATGGEFLGKSVEQGNVLYLAFEDNPRRLQSRMRKQDYPLTDNIQFYPMGCWEPFNTTGLDDLIAELNKNPYRLVVIDTLSRAYPGLDQNEMHKIGPQLDKLQVLAQSKNIGLVLLDHLRKPGLSDPNPVDDIANSTGKVTGADTIIGLYKQQGVSGARLMGVGRETAEFDLQLGWDLATCTWQLEGETGAIKMTEQRQEIIDVLKALGPSTLTSISRAIGGHTSNTLTKLYKLVEAGLIVTDKVDGRPVYRLP